MGYILWNLKAFPLDVGFERNKLSTRHKVVHCCSVTYIAPKTKYYVCLLEVLNKRVYLDNDGIIAASQLLHIVHLFVIPNSQSGDKGKRLASKINAPNNCLLVLTQYT